MPATATESPLGINASFSDGSACRLLVDRVGRRGHTVTTRNPRLAWDLLQGLEDLVHPHGDLDKTASVAAYLGAIRFLTNGLADRGFFGGAGDLTRATLASHWMEHRHPVNEGKARAMLLRLDELHGVLQPGVRELVGGRRFASRRSQDRGTLPTYTETEWERITSTCKSVVKRAYQVHREALEEAGRAEDPRVGGWSLPNLRWAYVNLGPVEAGPLAIWRRGHPSGLGPRAFTNRFRMKYAMDGLYPDAGTVIAYRLLLGVYTGIVPDGLADLGLGDVDWAGDSTVLLNYVKGRTAEESRTLSPRAGRLLMQWTDHSSLTRRFAPEEVRGALWLRYERYGGEPWCTTAARDSSTVARWVAAQGLVGDDGAPLSIHQHRIRTTYDSMRDRRSWMGSRRATMDPNRSPQVEADHYLGAGTPKQRELVDEIIAEAQNDMLRRAEPPIVLAQENVAALLRDYPERIAALNLDDQALSDLVGGERDVFTAACGDQLSGLHGPKGKPCPARPWVCLMCPLALFTPRHLPNLMRLKAFFARQWQQMTAAEFLGVFGLYAQRLDDILAPDAYFTSSDLAAAAAQVTDHDVELPLRPEETTR